MFSVLIPFNFYSVSAMRKFLCVYFLSGLIIYRKIHMSVVGNIGRAIKQQAAFYRMLFHFIRQLNSYV